MRLNKYIADSGLCSRRKADELISQGKVTINGKIAQVGDQVNQNDNVKVNGKDILARKEDVYLVFHKPYGVICTTDPTANNSIYDYLPAKERLLYVGRLDVESSGLMLLTNNGDVAQRISSPRSHHEKEYLVHVDKPITNNFIESMSKGVMIDGRKTAPAKLRQTNPEMFVITLTEGRNRQIRRMCAILGYHVTAIKRTRIMNLKLGALGPGNSRPLTKTERRELLEQLNIRAY